MNKWLNLSISAILLSLSTTLASAATLSGQLGVAAPTVNSFTPNGGLPSTTITFNPSTYMVSPGQGDLAGSSLTYTSGAFTFAIGTPMTPETLLTLMGGAGFTGTASFGVTMVELNSVTGTYDFLGILTGSSFTATGADFSFTPLNLTNGGGTPITTDGEYSARLFTTGAVATPEPSSLVFLGTGLVSVSGVLMRKRRRLV